MCSGSQKKACCVDSNLGDMASTCSILLELAADDDLSGFKVAVEEERSNLNESGIWYGRKIGSKQMGFEERTPLMIASMFGSKNVLEYILQHGGVDVNRACGSDGATALHCAVAGGSAISDEIVKLLLNASADLDSVDANGKRPADLLTMVSSSCTNAKKKMLMIMLNGGSDLEERSDLNDQETDQLDGRQVSVPVVCRNGSEKKEYPIDPSLPDIKTGIYGTDEFRIYSFKVRPCSRAYSHDWTECPFVHPGENARRRDPRKYHYSCVPCPEFRKGSCLQGDICEYAHGIFECWLHPAQYRTRLCKDETNCTRRVCFFAHKPEELRPLYASTGSAVPSPRSFSPVPSALDLSSISPLGLSSPSAMMPSNSTPPLTPSAGSSMWANQSVLTPTSSQFPGSRLKSAVNARDIRLDTELLGLDSHHHRHQQFLDDFTNLSSPGSWSNGLFNGNTYRDSSFDRESNGIRHNGLNPSDLEDIFGPLDSTLLSQLQGLSMHDGQTQLLSPKSIQLRQNAIMQQRPSYNGSLASSPVRTSSYGIDLSGKTAPGLHTKLAAFAKRSQSFIERNPSPIYGDATPSALSGWSSPDGKLDWGIQKDEINKLRKSASFNYRKSGNNFTAMAHAADEPDVSWNQTFARDVTAFNRNEVDYEHYKINGIDYELQTS